MYQVYYCRDYLTLYQFIQKANEEHYLIITITEKNGYTVLYKEE